MESVQGPLPKQASASAHLLNCFSSSSPPSELSPPFPPPLLPSSQALFWNISGAHAPHNLIHQASHWSLHCSDTHMPPHAPDLSNVLQLTHGASSRAALDGAGANNACTPICLAEIDALATPSNTAVGPALLLEKCMNSEKSQSFTHSAVSAPSFYCKLDMAAHKSRNTPLASLSAHLAEDSVMFSVAEHNGPALTCMGDNSICGFQGDGKSNQSRAEQSSKEEDRNEWPEKQAEKDLLTQRAGTGGGSAHSLGDSAIGLKLGKRTYFGDSGVGGVVEASKQVPNGATSSSNGGSIVSSTSGGSTKKWKASAPASNVPRCQAEDCKIDLTGAKEYHRRHKVCEWHSKSSKVKVANLEQRFCQQCSRFHLLTEFDEGKRSCRRRLAGHNERRRKQQPEPFPLLSAASYAYFAGGKQLFNPSLLDRPCFFEHEHAGADFTEPHKPKLEPVENCQSLELHHFMQASQRGGDKHLLLGGAAAQALILAGGNGTNLGSLSTPQATLTACLVPDHPPPPSVETLVSGRALSLLSSSLGFPNTSNSVSTALGVSLPSCERRRILENHQGTSSHQIIARVSSCFTPNALKPIETLPLSDDNTLSGLESGAFSHCFSVNRVQPSTILSFSGSSAFPVSYVNDGQSGAARPMLDLMQGPFARSGMPRQQVEHQFTTDLEGLSIFGRQSLM